MLELGQADSLGHTQIDVTFLFAPIISAIFMTCNLLLNYTVSNLLLTWIKHPVKKDRLVHTILTGKNVASACADIG
jgi:hypothetical protein